MLGTTSASKGQKAKGEIEARSRETKWAIGPFVMPCMYVTIPKNPRKSGWHFSVKAGRTAPYLDDGTILRRTHKIEGGDQLIRGSGRAGLRSARRQSSTPT